MRGSSLGGLLALHAARIDPRVRAVVALCPARPERLAARLDEDWPRRLSPEPPARPDGVARGYWHATGDDRVPWGGTFALAGRTPPPVRLRSSSAAATAACSTIRPSSPRPSPSSRRHLA